MNIMNIGEVMAIGKTFEEAIQKAVRMVSGGNMDGLDGKMVEGGEIEDLLRRPTDKRLFVIQYALEHGYTVEGRYAK